MWLAEELQHSIIAFIYPFACRSAFFDHRLDVMPVFGLV
jgi:hypothetical protein